VNIIIKLKIPTGTSSVFHVSALSWEGTQRANF